MSGAEAPPAMAPAPASAAAPAPAEGTDRPAAGGRDWGPPPRRRPARPSRLPKLGEDVAPATRWALRALSVAVPLVVWVALSASGAVDDTFLPSPAAVARALADMARSGELFSDMASSVRRVGLGFLIAVAISVPLGFAMGSMSWAQALLEPVIGLLRYMPASAFIPLLIIWLGLGESSKIALLVIGVVFFNTLMTADVVRRIPRDLLEVSATLGARQHEIARKVILPYALPGMIDAMRVNAAAAWNFVVVAELVAATSGLGYRITRAQRFLQTDKIFAVLVVIGVIGLAIDILLRVLRDQVGRWAP
ncbi:ABC transporter permease [Pseudofrankia asymbiotica]|uniref:ABC transporter permease n=1 Tax=Pseudofrankia asymbiotica TaxID=1834516 RepID=UPI000976B4DF|nr:ABC transporter permease [Pseudofrankia asymbiotica]